MEKRAAYRTADRAPRLLAEFLLECRGSARALTSKRGGRREGRVDAHSHVGGEARHAVVGELLVTKGDDGTNGRGALSLGVRETSAHRKAFAVAKLHLQRPQPALVPPRPRDVPNDAGFVILETLHFQQAR